MPEIDDKVMKFVEETLTDEPGILLEELYHRAKAFKSSVGDLSRRQFNARYPLQVKRRRALAERARGPSLRPAGNAVRRGSRGSGGRPLEGRDLVRGVFFQFASDLAAADDRKDLVKVLARVDQYVDRVMSGVSKD